ncbi:MAG: sodium transporter, partial [Flavobacterium sp.]
TEATEKKLVKVGKMTILAAMIIAIMVAPFLGIDKKGGFQYIQEYTGFVSPGIFAMFILGFFWKKTTSNAALFATIGGFIFSIVFKFMPAFLDLSWLYRFGFSVPNAEGVYEIPFVDRMGFVFLICVTGMYFISIYENKKGVQAHGLEVDKSMFRMSPSFTVGMLVITSILAALYTVFW